MTIVILTAVAALAFFVAAYAIGLVGVQAVLIEAQRERIELECKATAIAQRREEYLTVAIEQQQSRIWILIDQNGDLEDRNALLERVVKVRKLAAILDMSVMDGPTVLGRVRQMSRN